MDDSTKPNHSFNKSTFTDNLMPTENQKGQSEKFASCVFIATAGVFLICIIFAEAIGHPQVERALAMIFWVFFAVWNGVGFYTRRFTWKNGPAFTREKTPARFSVSATLFAVGSMSITTFFVWASWFVL